MRAPKKLGVLVAGNLLALANAQASEYGDPYENGNPAPTGSSGGWQAPNGGSGPSSPGNSATWPSPSDGQGSGSSGNAGDWPGAPNGQGPGSSGSPSGYDGSSGTNNAPGSSGDSGDTSPWQKPSGETAPSPNNGGNGNGQSSPTCPFQSTTTVFVTVQPSKVVDSAPTSEPSGGWPAGGSSPGGSSNGAPDGSSPDGPSPDDSSDSPSNGNSDGSSPDGNSNGPSSDGSDPGSSDSSSSQDPSDSAPSSDGSNSGSAPPYGSDDSSSNTAPSDDPASGSSGDSPSDDSGSDAGDSQPGDSGEPPVTSAFSADPVSGTGDAEPFTTIAIDIWGTGSESAPSASAGPTNPSSASPYGDDGTSNTNGNGADSDAPDPQASGSPSDDSSDSDSGNGSIPSGGSSDMPPASSGVPSDPNSGNSDGGSGPGPGPADPNNGSGSDSGNSNGGPDSDSGNSNGNSGSDAPPYGSSGNGAPQETRPFVTHGRPSATGSNQDWPSPPKFTSSPDGSPSGSGSSDAGNPADGAPYSVTITGPDGQPTVVTHPWGHGSDGESGSFPADTYNSGVGSQSADPVSGGVEGPFITPFPSGVSSDPSGDNSNPDGEDSGPSTCITILGDDGRATVVEWPWVNPASLSQPGPLITNGPSPGGSGNSDGSANPGDDAVFTSVTILGDDGKPTVVNWPPPGPADDSESDQGPVVTVTAGPNGSGSTDGGVLTDGDALPLPGASETCITILGTDGQPTVVDWPLTSASDSNGSGQGPVITGTPGDADSGDSGVLTDGGAFPGPEETCVTILGSDGQPTVVDWPWTNTDGAGAPGPVVTSGPFGNGDEGDNNGPVITTGPFGNGQGGGNGPISDGSALPEGASVTCASLTLLGDDGKPTVVETSWVVSPANATPGSGSASGSGSNDNGDLTGLPDGISAQIPGPTDASGPGAGGPSTTCFTVIGNDGQPTVIESTFLPSDGAGPFIPGPGATLIPGPDANNLPNSGDAPQTLSTTYTVIGPNGQPSVIETTWMASPASSTGSPVISGAGAPLSAPAGQITGMPGSPVPGVPQDGSGITTCTTYTVIGPDGLPSAVETSWVIPADGTGAGSLPQLTSGIGAAPWSASPNGPAAPSAFRADPISGLGGLPNGQGFPEGASTTCITVLTTGTDGNVTPVEQTVVLPPTAAPLPGDLTAQSSLPLTTGGVSGGPPSGPIVGTGEDPSNLSGYNNGASAADAGTVAPPNGPPFPPVITDGASDPLTASEPTSTVTRTGTITSFVFTDPVGGSQPSGVSPPAYGDDTGGPLGDAVPPNGLPGSLPSESTLFPGATSGSPAGYGGESNAAGAPVTSTWTNVVADQTTTHLVNFPLTTLATLKARHVRRQDSPGPWANSSKPVTEPLPPVTPLPAETTALPLPVPPPTNGSSTEPAPSNPGSAPPVCPTGGKIGNTTVNFDTAKAGPLFNPDSDLWFSEGFVIAPPSSQSSQAFVATSGGQLVEFVPASAVPNGQAGGSDVAEVGMGVNSASPCYRFDFYGASLGCAAQAPEAWCEFEISAYRWNPATSQEEPIAVSETKRVPACPTFPEGPCALTPVELEGYTDITGVLITTRVGLEARPWWGDDFRFGWSDNSCTAATCRAANSVAPRIKRETLKTALRRGVWHYTPEGMERLHDDYIWNAVH